MIADICLKLLLSTDDGWHLYEVIAAYILKMTDIYMKQLVSTEDSWHVCEVITVATADSLYLYEEIIPVYWR